MKFYSFCPRKCFSPYNLVAKSKTTSIHLGLRRIIFNLNVYKIGTSNVVPKCTLYNIVHMNRKSIASTHPFKSTDWLSSKNHWSIDPLFRASFVICLIKNGRNGNISLLKLLLLDWMKCKWLIYNKKKLVIYQYKCHWANWFSDICQNIRLLKESPG